MFYNCPSLKSIEGLKYLDTKDISNFSFMFFECSLLEDISPLNNLSGMFYGCRSLSNIEPLENWDVSNVENFRGMFFMCNGKFNNVRPLKNWNVSNGKIFECMFGYLDGIDYFEQLKNWNSSNGIEFESMFVGCINNAESIRALQKYCKISEDINLFWRQPPSFEKDEYEEF